MKILHTADLHLGKNLYETSLLNNQKKMLDSILQIISSNDYGALIIAGDIYDRSIPPAEAVSVFDSFLSEMRTNFPTTAILMIPGNHDSAERLSFGSQIFKTENIHIITDTANLCTPVIISHNNEKVQFFLLPFLHLGSFSDENSQIPLNSQNGMAEYAAELLKSKLNKNLPSVLAAHFFTLNGISSDSERKFLGSAEFINPETFNFFTYTALGHLHKPQKITDRMYYSGSPLAYSFDECGYEKSVLSVDINCHEKDFPISVTKIPIIPERKLSKLQGAFLDFFDGNKFNEYRNDFLEITLTDNQIIKSPMNLLKKKFPYLLNIEQKAITDNLKNEEINYERIFKKDIDDPTVILENFLQFEKLINENVSEEKKNLFTEIYTEIISTRNDSQEA